MSAIQIIVHGRVQGVGFRAFVAGEARRRRLSGWVRNRRDGTVEAVLAGDDDTLAAMRAACGEGPPGARVDRLDMADWDGPVPPGFEVRPTA